MSLLTQKVGVILKKSIEKIKSGQSKKKNDAQYLFKNPTDIFKKCTKVFKNLHPDLGKVHLDNQKPPTLPLTAPPYSESSSKIDHFLHFIKNPLKTPIHSKYHLNS